MTLRQFGKAFLEVILFMVIWTVVLLAAIYIPPRIGLSDNVVTVLILILTLLIFISFLPFLNYVARSVFFFTRKATWNRFSSLPANCFHVPRHWFHERFLTLYPVDRQQR